MDKKDPFDPDKDEVNKVRHGISLKRVADFVEAKTLVDDRFNYGEVRYRAWGHIEGVAYYLAFTFRDCRMRPISLRRAHAKEMKRHVQET